MLKLGKAPQLNCVNYTKTDFDYGGMPNQFTKKNKATS